MYLHWEACEKGGTALPRRHRQSLRRRRCIYSPPQAGGVHAPRLSRSITIQCKTNQRTARKWLLNEKSEEFVSKDHFYVFVALGQPTDRPRFHVVPSKVVAERTKKGHRKWLETPGKKGQQHRDTPMRNFFDPEDECLERWELLGMG